MYVLSLLGTTDELREYCVNLVDFLSASSELAFDWPPSPESDWSSLGHSSTLKSTLFFHHGALLDLTVTMNKQTKWLE